MGERRFQYSTKKLWQLWGSGASYHEIAAALGCHSGTVQKLKERHKLPNRRKKEPVFCEEWEPTDEEIAEHKRRAQECRERHFAKRRAETHVQTDSRLSKERQN